ncbi:methylenetetrahydrofolate reductase [Enterococcus sp. CSURQ0835]|uniref:methylenetetrahydrofolate reductase n=1 Tax=Enterococcus sp. CSURQ0835 TaxID=2681394 RepID=UPI001359C52C|nr:methylenetetrahydrofolate reductase [Enterococcus sp. CSURQ0835]
MKLSSIYQKKDCVISFEVFPPKKTDSIEKIYATLEQTTDYQPDFISVTYGAGGSIADQQTLAIAATLKEKYQIESLHHLTCVKKSQAEIDQIVAAIKAHNIENILALRGDLPLTDADLPDFHYAKDLIGYLHQTQPDLCLGAACYPEGHISQLDCHENSQHLLAKQTSGAEFLISQLFFDNRVFYQLMEQAQQAGVTIPISAGIMPILSQQQVAKMIFMCGSSLPAELIKLIHRYGHDAPSLRQAGLEYALTQMEDLKKQGVDGIHVYTMNRPEIARAAMELLR